LSEAFARAGPDQEIVVMALSKPDDDVIFKRKRLTSFVTFIKGDHLYVRLSKSNSPSRRIKTGAPLPLPWPDSDKEKFSVLQNQLYTAVGPRGVRVPWRSSAFGTDGDTRADPQRTERSPPRFSMDELADPLEALPVEALRALIFLEETHNAGLVGDAEYRLKRAGILNGLRENPGSP
jgi:hypothetical protein